MRCLQIFTDPIFYLFVYGINRFKQKKQFFMVPIAHDIIQAQALVWVGYRMFASVLRLTINQTLIYSAIFRRRIRRAY